MSIKKTLSMARDYDDKPTVTFTAKQLPEIKDWKIGGKYKLEIDVEQVGINKNEYGEKETTGRFKVLKVSVDDDKDEDNEDDKY